MIRTPRKRRARPAKPISTAANWRCGSMRRRRRCACSGWRRAGARKTATNGSPQMLAESFGQDFLVENVSGARGVRGALMVAAAPGDGYTLMVATSDLAIAPVMSSKVGYDALRNFVPISIISRSPSVLLLHPSVPAKTVQEFATLARADPPKYSYASMSLGQNLLNTERLFRLTLKLPIVRIPFPGAAPILSSTAAGHTLVAYIGLPPATPFIKEGTLQALAVTSPKPSPIAPDVT